MSCWGWSSVPAIVKAVMGREGTYAGMASDVRMLVGGAYDVIEQMVTTLGKFAELRSSPYPCNLLLSVRLPSDELAVF